MYSIGLNFEYSRMNVPSLSSGCEIAPFFVRYMVNNLIFFDINLSLPNEDLGRRNKR